MNALTWTCHVCGDERPDAAISVHASTLTVRGFAIQQNVRHCNDRPACVAGAPAVRFVREDRDDE